jgi:SAM-dependent methyltransferase
VNREDAASQFYTGLIADLYEPLVSEYARADHYTAFLDRAGTPALELCCGSGLPLIELVERGYAVEGLDASRDMLDRCRARAEQKGLSVQLHEGEMQSFSLGRRYRAIFLAGASFTLLTDDADAARTLERIHDHLEPGGSVLIPLETVDAERLKDAIGYFREVESESGERLRVGMVAVEASADGRDLGIQLRYERISVGREPEIVERRWQRRWWPQSAFSEMLRAAGFEGIRVVAPGGGAVTAEASEFVFLARRAAASAPGR